jgi:imidazolonepropionase-like amidohydrolase
MKRLIFALAAAAMMFAAPVFAQQSAPKPKTLFTNVNVFDGVNEKRIMNASVLVEGNLIRQVSTGKIDAPGATVIDGGGRTLMPGLTDVHWHMTMAEAPQTLLLSGDVYDVAARAVPAAERTLMRGFTTVRDIGGNAFAIKRLIDSGVIVGPRMLVAGPPLSQTGGIMITACPMRFRRKVPLITGGGPGFSLSPTGSPKSASGPAKYSEWGQASSRSPSAAA